MIRRLAAAFALLSLGSGCAATSPILVEPRTVAPGEMRVQAGGAVLAPIAGDSNKVAESRQIMASPPTTGAAVGSAGHDDEIRRVLPGAAIAYAMRPGFAPLARATVGLQPGLEASVLYGGRDIGVGGRWVMFEDRTDQAAAITLSLAGNVRTILRHRPEDGMLAGAITDDVKGYGGVLPLILGYQSEAGLVTGWIAALVGFDTVNARVAFPTLEPDPEAAPFRALSAQRTFAAATIGMGLGFRGVRVGVELGIERDWVSFSSDLGDSKLKVWSLAPAFAISTTL